MIGWQHNQLRAKLALSEIFHSAVLLLVLMLKSFQVCLCQHYIYFKVEPIILSVSSYLLRKGNEFSNVKDEEESAVKIQALWRGHQTRQNNEAVLNIQEALKSQRMDDHVKFLTMELERYICWPGNFEDLCSYPGRYTSRVAIFSC